MKHINCRMEESFLANQKNPQKLICETNGSITYLFKSYKHSKIIFIEI